MEQSVASAFESYLATADLRPSSIRFKRMSLKYFLEWFGDIPADKVTLAIADDYRTMLAKGRSKRSANGYLSNFKPFWGWLQRHGRISGNPFDGIQLYRITEEPKETFKADELSRLIICSNRLWRIRICLGLLGCRRGETLNIVVRDIKMTDPNPHILLAPKKQTKKTWPWDLKSHAVRYIALPETIQFNGGTVVGLHNDIVQRIDELPKNQPYLCIENNYYEKLIELQKEGKLTDIHATDPTGNFQRSFRALQKRAAVYPLKRYHELRAAFITQVADEHGLPRAAEAAGHSSVETTRRYCRFSKMSLVGVLNSLASKCYQDQD